MEKKNNLFFHIPFACDLMQKSLAQVLSECAAFDARSLTDDELCDYRIDKHHGQFDAKVQFICDFRIRDYQAFSIVTISIIENKAVECIISLGRPANLNRYGSELEVTKIVLFSLEELYLNGRIQKEDETRTMVYTWKKDNRTVVSFISYLPSERPTDTGARLGVQIRDTKLHPQGGYLELLYNGAQDSVQDLGKEGGDERNSPTHRVSADPSEPLGGNDMSEEKMRDLLAQGYSIKQIAETLDMAEDFIQEVVDEEWGQYDFRTLIDKRVLVKSKLKEPRTERVSIGTAIVIIKEISDSGDRVLLEYPEASSMNLWSEAKNLKIIRELSSEEDSPTQDVGAGPVEATGISTQLKSICRDCITTLGVALDIAIRDRHEYEAGFNDAMDLLSGKHASGEISKGVSKEDRPQMLAEVKRYAEVAGIPYNKLSPLNQFVVTIPPYVFYCLEKYLPNDPDLREEARRLINTKGFPRYLQEDLGYPISQRIKGAFWVPKVPGFLARLFRLRGRR